jgi:hypothetical protein
MERISRFDKFLYKNTDAVFGFMFAVTMILLVFIFLIIIKSNIIDGGSIVFPSKEFLKHNRKIDEDFAYLFEEYLVAYPDTTTSFENLETIEKSILLNTLFAINNYRFENPETHAYFDRFMWYKPDPSIPKDISILGVKEKMIYKEIVRGSGTFQYKTER